ncbi:MAG: transporter substrate-binding domain-containing protein [Clostridia bacterium]|nr:transporter substrate-binding domain-containing protein [Clostridia bacterium]
MKKVLSILLAALLLIGCAASFASCTQKQNLTFGKEMLAVGSQLDALNGLLKGDADIAVIDSVMAGYYMNSTETFKDYQVLSGVVLAEEQYGIAAKKGNNALIGKINEAIIALADTDYKTIATTYGLATETLVTATTQNPDANATDGSWDKIVSSKKIVIGYTEFAPIAYHEGDGENAKFVGFDIDLAKAVVAYLNTTYSAQIEIEFELIDWNQKEALLENGSIDLVWNGMTITDERIAAMAVSIPYLANKQVAIVEKTDAAKYGSTKETLIANAKDAIVIVEKGSAGEEIVCPVE